MNCVKTFALLLALAASPVAFPNQSMSVLGAIDSAGRTELTIVNKDPPGVGCNGYVQVAAEIRNSYLVPFQILPSSLVPNLPAPAVFYGQEMIAVDAKDHNGQASFQMVADVLELEGAPKQPKAGLIHQDKVRREFEALNSTIETRGN